MGGGNKAGSKPHLSLGNLVLAKVKGFPPWPAKVSRPEDWKKSHDPKRIFVYFFGIGEIAFVAPANIQVFTSEMKSELVVQCQGKNKLVRGFSPAVKEICAAFDELQSSQSSILRDDMYEFQQSVDISEGDGIEDDKGMGDNSTGITKDTTNVVSSDACFNLDSCLLGKSQGDNQDIMASTSTNTKYNPWLTIYSEKNRNSGSVHTKKASVSVGFPMSNKKSSGVKGHGSPKQSDIEHKVFSSSCKVKNGGASSKRETAGGNKLGDQIRGNLPRGDHRLDYDIPWRSNQISKTTGHLEESNGLEYIEMLDKQSHRHTFGQKSCVVVGPGKPSSENGDGQFYPKKYTHSKINVDMVPSLHKRIKQEGSIGANISVDEPIQLLESNKTIVGLRGVFNSKLTTSVGSVNSLGKSSLSAKHCRWPAKYYVNGFDDGGENVPHGSEKEATPSIGILSTRLPKKRKAVYLYEDDEDAPPKTPVHERPSGNVKVSGVHNPKITNAAGGDCNVSKIGSGGSKVDLPMEPFSQKVDAVAPLQLPALENITKRETSASVSSSSKGSELENLTLNLVKEIVISPKISHRLIHVKRPTSEKNQLSKPQARLSNTDKLRVSCGSHKDLNSSSDDLKACKSWSSCQRDRAESSLDRLNGTPKEISVTHVSALKENAAEFIHSQPERLDVAEDNGTLFCSASTLGSTLSMKLLIAAAQAKRRKTQAHNFPAGALSFPAVLRTSVLGSPSSSDQHLPPSTNSLVQAELQGSNNNIKLTSPYACAKLTGSQTQQNYENLAERKANFVAGHARESRIGGTEADAARDTFEGMIETLSRTKDSIGRATRHAIDCARFGIANEVVELLIRKLEDEQSFHRKVNLFFLVDSITQCSHSQKGIAGASYIPIVQSALPRLLGGAAPPGAAACENRRQCLKILRLWLERKILPEYLLRRYMDDIGESNDDMTSESSIRHASRVERAVDDPVRGMESILVDEYGSNVTFQLAGFLNSHIFEDDEKEEDRDLLVFPSKEDSTAISPEKLTLVSKEARSSEATPGEQHHCILLDVDCEIDMEDVSGHPKDGGSLSMHTAQLRAESHETDKIDDLASTDSSMFAFLLGCSPPLPLNSPPLSPPLPPSPPRPLPLSPSPSPSPPPPLPPTLPLPLPLPPPPHLAPHLSPPPPPPPPPPLLSLPSELQVAPPSHSGFPPFITPTFVALPHPLLVPTQLSFKSLPQLSNHTVQMPSQNLHEIFADSFVKSELSMQQSLFFYPAGVNSGESSGFNSSRHIEMGCSGKYTSSQTSQDHRHQQSNMHYAQRSLHIMSNQNMSSQYSYMKPPIHQHPSRHHPYAHQYSSPPPDDRRQFGSDESWMPSSSEYNAEKQSGPWMNGASSTVDRAHSQEGYVPADFDRPRSKGMPFKPSMKNPSLPTPFPGHAGAQMMPSRPDMSSSNCWRPA